jgi:nucleoside-diphosphate-sugar epimerase
MRHVLVTGASGYIAAQLLPAFRERYELVLLDRATDRDGQPVPGATAVNLLDPDREAYRACFQGVETVVHLAWNRPSGDPATAYVDERVNLDLAYNIYQTALEEGVERVVVASSNHAADWYEHLIRARALEMVYPESFPLSDNFYGWAKTGYETLGFVYASGALGRKLGVVQIRIGAPRELPVERYRGDPAHYRRDLGAWISPRDLAQLFVKSIEAPSIDNAHGVPFQIFYGISGNARAFWSIANARRVIGYAPRDDSEVRYADGIRQLLVDGREETLDE